MIQMKAFLQIVAMIALAGFIINMMVDVQYNYAVRDWFTSSIWHWLPISIILLYVVNKITEK